MIALLRRLRPPAANAPVLALPPVWLDADGEVYWSRGHVPAATMVLASVSHHFLRLGPLEGLELLFDGDLLTAQQSPEKARAHVAALVANVEHVWVREDRDGCWQVCSPSHELAEVATRMRCW